MNYWERYLLDANFGQCDQNLPCYDKAIRLPWWALADKLRSVNANREATVLFIVLAAILAILLLD
ncbi:MAG: hypothetical protein Udaeo2_11600 [Candidatus Udaeobacter sp.]|nr:MAG: hypothetical protein Udaeo2_11600 [Candidatus Udaeobacter sp.]